MTVTSWMRYATRSAEMRDGKAKVFPGTYTEMKGSKTFHEVLVEEAAFYKVISSFTEWTIQEELQDRG